MKQNSQFPELPRCGTWFGIPIYLHRGDTIFQTSGLYYTSWVSEDHDVDWYIEKIISENQGNMVVIWDGGATKQSLLAMADYMALEELGLEVPRPDWKSGRNLVPADWAEIERNPERLGAGLVRWIKKAREHGLSLATIYTEAHPQQLERLKPHLDSFLGCNVGEVFSVRLDSSTDGGVDMQQEAPDNLGQMAANFIQSVKNCVAQKNSDGWHRLMVTGTIGMLDYEVIGGIQIPAPEDFATPHINIASALARGLYRQFKLPIWGTDIAHEHYSFLPYASPYKMPMLTASFYLKYLAGCKLIMVESGNWWQQSDHVEDTKMHQVPKLDLGSIRVNDPRLSAPYVEEARKHYPNINYDSDICREYRRLTSEFYDFLKENGTPEGQPEARIAAIKGNLDLVGPDNYNPNSVIVGQTDLADQDVRWLHGTPERGWGIFEDTFYPKPGVLEPHLNKYFSGTPYGLTDIVSFASVPSVEFLVSNYAALLFTGWNTCTDQQYELLLEYTRRGGVVFAALPHFSTNNRRNYNNYQVEELIRGGDLSELCGVKVVGRGKKFYWVVSPEPDNLLGIPPHRKHGVCMTHMGDLELSPEVEVVAVEDEGFKPVLVKHKVGEGCVYLLNTWEYPGALKDDTAPGATNDSLGFIGAIYRMIALQARGDTYITDDGCLPGNECRHITWSFFPENGEICLFNVDFVDSHKIQLHHRGTRREIVLKPQEFIITK